MVERQILSDRNRDIVLRYMNDEGAGCQVQIDFHKHYKFFIMCI